MDELQAMKPVEVPIYDFTSHSRSGQTQHVEPADVVIMEGILVLHIPEVRKMFNMKIFVVSNLASCFAEDRVLLSLVRH